MHKSKTYAEAVNALNSLQTPFLTLEARRRQGLKMDDSAVTEMRQWLYRAGHNVSPLKLNGINSGALANTVVVQIPELSSLNIVHVAGTKGKGSTCAFVNSILTQNHALNGIPGKIGLYTSPHLLDVRERIRINSVPISEVSFAAYFFEVWEALEQSAKADGRDPSQKPNYFRFLTLMSFHVFLKEQVDTAIYEVGIGGAWDSTNIIEAPAVTGITTLGIDHVAVLGDTIEKIAWHKSGIFKAGCPAYTVQQLPAASQVLEQRAKDKGIQLGTVDIHPALSRVDIVPDADFQRQNASLAIVLANTVLGKMGQEAFSLEEEVPPTIKHGLEQCEWRGRCEIKKTGAKTWFLDGAHTEDSLKVAGRWFAGQTQKRYTLQKIMIFNQQSRPEANDLLKVLHHALNTHGVRFDHAVFCTNVTRRGKGYRNAFVDRNADPEKVTSLAVQKGFAELWRKIADRCGEIHVMPTIEDAVDFAQDLCDDDEELHIFATGSIRLIGGIISILEGVQTPTPPMSPLSPASLDGDLVEKG